MNIIQENKISFQPIIKAKIYKVCELITSIITKQIKLSTIVLATIGTITVILINQGNSKEIIFGEIAGLINLLAYLPYLTSIVQQKTKPSKTTWWIWSTLEIMLGTSYILSGADGTKWLPIAAFVGMLLTAILSIYYGKKEWTPIDTTCLVGSVIGAIIWYISGNPIIALYSFFTIDILAAIPTFIKSYKYPYEEDLFAWIISLVSGVINLFAIDTIKFEILMLPIYNLAIYVIVVIILFTKRNYLLQQQNRHRRIHSARHAN